MSPIITTKLKEDIDEGIIISEKLKTKFEDPFSEEVWRYTYKDHQDNTVDDTFLRVASFIASAEATPALQDLWTMRFYDMLSDFKCTAGGRIYSNAGTEFEGTTMLNCYVAPRKKYDIDSIPNIIHNLFNQSMTLKSEGGWGENFSYLRPRGTFIHGIGVESPGAVKFMELFDKSSDIVTSGSGIKSLNKKSKGKIRKGAMMGVLDDWHPDIIEFITAKQQPGRLTKFNVSVNFSDEFMNKIIKVVKLKEQLSVSEIPDDEHYRHMQTQIEEADKWDLRFPVTTFEKYKPEWDGNIIAWETKGYPVNVYKTVSATWLWDLVMESTYCRAEPGVLFLDRANYYNPISSYGVEKIQACNPCSEQMLAESGVCNLGSINLTQFILKDRSGFDIKKIEKVIPVMVRFLDNVNTVTNTPLEEYKKSVREKRRIGCGVLGWGSSLFMLKVRFGSDRANQLREKIMSTIARSAYMASIDLAEEKGMFSLCNPDKHAKAPFIINLDLPKEYTEKLLRFGIRNSSLLSIQPTGNSSVFANVVSGGIEPIFLPEYIRTVIINHMPEHIMDVTPKWYEGAWHETEMFKFTKEGDEEILRGVDNFGVVFKIDKNRGLTKEVLCEDYGVRYLKRLGEWEPAAEWAVTTINLTVSEHVNDLRGFARWIDSSISKCVGRGTLINTSEGIFKIEDLCPENKNANNFVDISHKNIFVNDQNGKKQKILKHYNGGCKPCFKIKFSNGYEIIASENHKFLSQFGWLTPENIDVGNKLFYRTNEIGKNTEQYVPITEMPRTTYRNQTAFDFPEYMTESLALFLGMWLADGYSNKNSIGIVEKDESVRLVVERLFKEIFGVAPRLYIDKRSGVRTHSIHSRYLSRYFKDHYGYNALTKKIPNEILLSNKTIQLSFIAGLSLDGYKKNNGLVIYEGYSKQICYVVASILQGLGYRYYIGQKLVKGGRLSKISYGIAAYPEKDSEIFCLEERKNLYSRLGYGDVQRYIEPEKQQGLIDSIEHSTKGCEYKRNIKNSLKVDNFVRESLLEKVGYSDYDINLSHAKVTKIEFIGENEVFDIEIENTHSYLIGGFVSHNTVNVPNDYPFDDFKNIYLDAYKSQHVKGITTYRAGTMATVLAAKDEICADCDDEEIIIEDVKLPAQSPCSLNVIRSDGRKWYLTVVMNEQRSRPVAFFVTTNHYEKEITTHDAVERLIDLASRKGIPQKWIEDVKRKMNSDNNSTRIARCISLNLRHGVLIKNVVAVLSDIDDVYVGTFLFQIRKFLMTFIKDGEKVSNGDCPECFAKDSFVYSEGCIRCSTCSWSKCG